jgi:ABC-type glycerol-3-phosphate transport system substrate-binding protein
MLGFWIAAGFLFTRKEWTKEVIYNTDFYFSGEEDYLSVISYVKGWDVYVPESSTIWHDYTDNRIQSPKKYRPLHWEDHPGVDAKIGLLKDLYENAFGQEGKRTVNQFVELAKQISKYDDKLNIEVIFNYDNIPIHNISKEAIVIIFAFYDESGNEIFRPDIDDKEIIERTKNSIVFEIPNNIHLRINSCLWWVKYEDGTFDNRIELPITKQGNIYKI